MLKPITALVPKKLTVIDRLIIKLGDSQQSSLCILQKQLPQIFRITAIEATLLTDSTYEINASIFHEKAQLDVQWETSTLDTRLAIGQLVTVRWKGTLSTHMGQLVISRLMPATAANVYVNLFNTVPVEWCLDRATLQRAAKLVELLPEEYKSIFNTIFWKSNTLYELVTSPSFKSTVENCERVLKCEYRFFININQAVIMLIINASTKQSVQAVIIKQIVEAKITHKDSVKSEYWSPLLMSLDY